MKHQSIAHLSDGVCDVQCHQCGRSSQGGGHRLVGSPHGGDHRLVGSPRGGGHRLVAGGSSRGGCLWPSARRAIAAIGSPCGGRRWSSAPSEACGGVHRLPARWLVSRGFSRALLWLHGLCFPRRPAFGFCGTTVMVVPGPLAGGLCDSDRAHEIGRGIAAGFGNPADNLSYGVNRMVCSGVGRRERCAF